MFRKLPAPRNFSGVGPARKLRPLFRGILFVAVFAFLFSIGSSFSNAVSCGGDVIKCRKEIERVKKEISRLQGLEDTLQNQIAYLDNQIYLTELEIKTKEEEIKLLSVDIGDLSQRLNRISSLLEYQEGVFATRARSAYTSDQLSPFDVVLGADSLDTTFRRIKYLKVLETQDRETLEEMRETRANFKEQKKTLESKKADVENLKQEVEAQKVSLIGQKADKNRLLEQTRGEESQYQQTLKQLRAELNSILAALRRGGKKLGYVSKGEKIWPQGNTGCTAGPTGIHIHFAVGIGPPGNSVIYYSSFRNPYDYVGRKGVGSVCHPWYLGYVVGKKFASPGGPGSCISQSYWWAHKALDIISSDGWVHAAESGNAYLVQDTTWKNWCWTGKKYNGPAYGIVIDHGGGLKSLYWHVQKP